VGARRASRALPGSREASVVRDAKDEGLRRALAPEAGEGLPDREEDLLGEVVTLGSRRRVGSDHAPERGPVNAEALLEVHAFLSPARRQDLTNRLLPGWQ